MVTISRRRAALAAVLLAGCGGSDGPTHIRHTVSTSARVARVVIAPDSIQLAPGTTASFTATPYDSSHAVVPGCAMTWQVSDTTVASIDPGGLVTGEAGGAAIVSARCDGVPGTALVRVKRNVFTLSVTPSLPSIAAGDTVRLRAALLDSVGSLVVGPSVAWSTADSTVAVVDSAGLVRGRSVGTVSISATAERRSGQTTITVHRQGPVLEIGGLWDWTETFTDGVNTCSDTGTYRFKETGATFAGASFQVGGCAPVFGLDGSRADTVVNGVLFADGMTFQVDDASCTYTASGSGAPVTHLSGTAVCGSWTGTWDALAVIPGDRVQISERQSMTLPVGAAVQLYSRVYNAAGQRAFGRPVTWSAGSPAVLAMPETTLFEAAAPGNGTAIVTLSGAASDTAPVQVKQGFRVTDSLFDTYGLTDATQYDATYLAATRDSEALTIVVGFVQGPHPWDLAGYLDLDIDENDSSGISPLVDAYGPPGTISGLGDEYYYDVYDAVLINPVTGDETALSPVFADSTITIRIPLVALAGSNGYVALAGVFGNIYEATDIIPNAGHVTMAGPLPVARIRASRFIARTAVLPPWRRGRVAAAMRRGSRFALKHGR